MSIRHLFIQFCYSLQLQKLQASDSLPFLQNLHFRGVNWPRTKSSSLFFFSEMLKRYSFDGYTVLLLVLQLRKTWF